eukprot:PhF_6_TR10014/c0_g7_i4/m.15311
MDNHYYVFAVLLSRPYVEGLTWHPLNDSNAWGDELIKKVKRNLSFISTKFGTRMNRFCLIYTFVVAPFSSQRMMAPTLTIVEPMTSERILKSGVYTRLTKTISRIRSTVGELHDKWVATWFISDRLVPYRNSVVTHMLKHTFGCHGCRTVVIGTLSPCSDQQSDSVCTIRLLDKWSNIPI